MRWLPVLCGDDGSKKTITRSVITDKIPAREFIFTSGIPREGLHSCQNSSRSSHGLDQKRPPRSPVSLLAAKNNHVVHGCQTSPKRGIPSRYTLVIKRFSECMGTSFIATVFSRSSGGCQTRLSVQATQTHASLFRTLPTTTQGASRFRTAGLKRFPKCSLESPVKPKTHQLDISSKI